MPCDKLHNMITHMPSLLRNILGLAKMEIKKKKELVSELTGNEVAMVTCCCLSPEKI